MRLTRSTDDVIVSGVLAGIGEYFQVDPTLIRIGVALLGFFTPFPVIPLYIIGAILIPKDTEVKKKFYPRKSSKTQPKSRDFEEKETRENPSPKATEINEEDWSDF